MDNLQAMARLLLEAVLAVIVMGGFANGSLTLLITNFLKRLPFFGAIGVNVLAFAIAALLTVGGLLAGYFGHETDFRNLIGFLETVLPPLLTLLGGAFGSAWIYDRMKMQNVWFLGTPKDIPLFGDAPPTAQATRRRGWD